MENTPAPFPAPVAAKRPARPFAPYAPAIGPKLRALLVAVFALFAFLGAIERLKTLQ